MLLWGCCEGNCDHWLLEVGAEEGTGVAVEVHNTLHQVGARHWKEVGTKEAGIDAVNSCFRHR